MRGRAAAVFAVVAMVVARGGVGCATAEAPGTPRDSCRVRDCGPTYGNPGSSLFPGGDDEVDEAAPLGDDAALVPIDDGSPAADTGAPDAPPSDAPIGDASPSDAPIADAPPACTVPAGATCALAPQCGCAAGEACDVASSSGGARCVAAGTKALGATCGAAGECAAGLTCFGGLCQRLCASDADCAGVTAASCAEIAPGARACLSQCDLRAPSTVCGADNCALVDGATGVTACIAAGGSYNGCTSNYYACAPRYACVPDASGTGDVCLRWCRVGVDTDCPTGKVCYAFSDHPTVSGVEYGVCDY